MATQLNHLFKTLAVSAALLLSTHTQAGTDIYPETRVFNTISVSGQAWLDDIESKDDNRIARSKNYLTGVLDASEGKVWCSYALVKPHILLASIYEKLKARPARDLQQRAAYLIEEELKNQRPCPKSRNANR